MSWKISLANILKKAVCKSVSFFTWGDACEIIPTLDEMFDLVFIDADKREYSEYYRLVFDKVRHGGNHCRGRRVVGW